MADRIVKTLYDPKRERWISGYVDAAGLVVEVIAEKPSTTPSPMRSGANKHRNKAGAISKLTERMDAAVDALSAHKLVAEHMDPLRGELIRGRISNGENIYNSDERAYRVAGNRAKLAARLSALRAARRKGPSEVMAEILRDARALNNQL